MVDEMLVYHNTTGAQQTLFLIADSGHVGQESDFLLSVDIGPTPRSTPGPDLAACFPDEP